LNSRKSQPEKKLASAITPTEHAHIEQKLRQLDTARSINDWLTSPGLKSPEQAFGRRH